MLVWPSSAFARFAFALVPLLFFFRAAPAAAQTVAGRVVGDSESEVIRGAVVTLLNASGEPVRRVLSNVNGAFLIRVTEPGTYRLQAEMIGRKTMESDPFAVGDNPQNITLALTTAPIRLDEVLVTAAARCAIGEDVAIATAQVWQEIQKALRAESVTREQALFQFDIVRERSTRDPNTLRSNDKEVTRTKSLSQTPFRTLPPPDIASDGYARNRGNEVMIYGPDTRVLLSPEFAETHCFSLQRSRHHPGEIGLAFRPIPGRRVTDIEGVLWMEVASAELRRLEFEYRKLPRDLTPGRYSGYVDFQRLESGAWIIGSWKLSTPLTTEGAEVVSLEPANLVERSAEPEGSQSQPQKPRIP